MLLNPLVKETDMTMIYFLMISGTLKRMNLTTVTSQMTKMIMNQPMKSFVTTLGRHQTMISSPIRR